ncbi:axoneme-associated protein [Lasius niger]|uniref:Axoneme-associated protein n=1 Tax=Lasius niger TaxID=67767 RepID=A0A0J7KK44_LASNI|nr:axoneme-associated protein [Lasius niger]
MIRKTIEDCEKGIRKDRGTKRVGGMRSVGKKRVARRELRRWRKGGGDGDRYRKSKREYKEFCEKKKNEEKERLIREIGEARTEGKVWDLVNRVRKRRKKLNEDIKMEEWRDYFISLLGEVENRVVKRTGKNNGREDEENKEIEWEEIKSAVRRARDGRWVGTRFQARHKSTEERK